MLIVEASKYKSIEQALKVYKQKHNNVGIVKELRERQTFTKPSVERRSEILKAIYMESKRQK